MILVISLQKKDIYLIIRHNIKKYRQLKNMTQSELADLSGYTHDYIRQIESEKIANTFSVQTLYDISIALNVDIGLLCKDNEK